MCAAVAVGARSVTWLEGLEEATSATAADARVKVLVLVPNPSVALLEEPRFLLVTQALPGALVANALAVSQAYREYQERSLAREGLKRMYIGTLTLALVVGAATLGLQPHQPLTHPEQARGTTKTAPKGPVDPGLRLVRLRDKATGDVQHLSLGPLQPALGNAEATLRQVDLDRHFRCTACVGLQRTCRSGAESNACASISPTTYRR